MVRFVSTAIPYVNAKPHIGHALEYVQADAYVRARRLAGDDVFLLTGTDDNALKNVQAAEKAGVPIEEYIGENAQHFIDLSLALDVRYDDFIRTSVDERHRAGVEKLWRATKPEDLYKKSYRGFYCVGCEEFKTGKDLINGECPEHPGKPLEEVEEENYFFKLSNYSDTLLKLIESGELKIIPEGRKNEIVSFVKGGLMDFSVSRSAARAKGWGIPVPGDTGQYLYVWYDALANYITALGYATGDDAYEKYWVKADERIHMVGKGINRFHSIYWPAMLLSAGVPLPTAIFVHGYVTSGGQKMSKTLGNVIDPRELIETYGADAVRYYLLRHISPFEDGDLTREGFKEAYTAHLTNGLGNLVARVMKLAETYLSAPADVPKGPYNPSVFEAVEDFKFNIAMDEIWEEIQALDQSITVDEPFKIIKKDSDMGRKAISGLVVGLQGIAEELAPFMHDTSEKILTAIRENKKPENLFPRLP